jgi:hypothetical protein
LEHGQRQTDVSQTYDADDRRPILDLLQQAHQFHLSASSEQL